MINKQKKVPIKKKKKKKQSDLNFMFAQNDNFT